MYRNKKRTPFSEFRCNEILINLIPRGITALFTVGLMMLMTIIIILIIYFGTYLFLSPFGMALFLPNLKFLVGSNHINKLWVNVHIRAVRIHSVDIKANLALRSLQKHGYLAMMITLGQSQLISITVMHSTLDPANTITSLFRSLWCSPEGDHNSEFPMRISLFQPHTQHCIIKKN